MSVNISNGLPYVGVQVHYGSDSTYPPASWTKINEVFELSDMTRTWDQVDMTSHDSFDKGMTRTSKPGLMGLVIVTFRGIWLPAEHTWLDAKFTSRQSWPYKFVYAFTSELTPTTYGGVAYIGEYGLAGDLGDKYVYSCQLVFNGEPQPLT